MAGLRQQLVAELGYGLAQRLRQPRGRHGTVTPLVFAGPFVADHDRYAAARQGNQLRGHHLGVKSIEDLGLVAAVVFLQ